MEITAFLNPHQSCCLKAAEIPRSLAHLNTLETVLREHGTDSAMFRSLNPKPFNLRISRYLVIILTLLKMNLRISAHTFILIRSRVWLNDAGIVAHSKTERWLTSTGQVAQNHPDYSIFRLLMWGVIPF
mgnify:CR=1 FL=1